MRGVGTSMSCNGCRILRKGCNDKCILRQSLEGMEAPQAQANATLFVAKFFGRATLLSSLSSVPLHRRPALFQSLLFEACGRTVNPVTGAVGLLSTGNWHACHAAVEAVLQGGALPEFHLGKGNSNIDQLYGREYLNMTKELDNETEETAAGLVPAPSQTLTSFAYPQQCYHDTNIFRLFL